MLFKNRESAIRLIVFSIPVILLASCTYKKQEINPCEGINSNYSQNIAPLIQIHCALSGCHNGDSTSVGNFKLYEELKTRVDNGQFETRVILSKSMPPFTRPPLSEEDFATLKCWFEGGAPND